MTHERQSIEDLERRNQALQDAIELLHKERESLAENLVRDRTVDLETQIQKLNDIISDQYVCNQSAKRGEERMAELLHRLAEQVVSDFQVLDKTFAVSGPKEAVHSLSTFTQLEQSGFFPSLSLALSAISEAKPSRAIPPDVKHGMKPMERGKRS